MSEEDGSGFYGEELEEAGLDLGEGCGCCGEGFGGDAGPAGGDDD